MREMEAGVGGLESSVGGGNSRSCTVFNKVNNSERGGFICVFMERAEGEGGKNKPSISICVCALIAAMILISFPLLLFPAGELEKQQGSKAPSLKNNGAQLELRGRQGSPSGACSCACTCAAKAGPRGFFASKLLFNLCPGNQDERSGHNAVEVSAQ